jgi:hypothetical protein
MGNPESWIAHSGRYFQDLSPCITEKPCRPLLVDLIGEGELDERNGECGDAVGGFRGGVKADDLNTWSVDSMIVC